MVDRLLSIDMNDASATPAVQRRRPTDDLLEALLAAAETEFAARGFEGASTRSIAHQAGAHQPQINYHFTSKELLWQAVVDRLFAALDDAVDLSTDASPSAVMAEGLRRFVEFSARRPELNRIINLEATRDSSRLRWLVEVHLRPRFAATSGLWEQTLVEGRGADMSATEVWDLLTAFGALRFANAPMVSMLEGSSSLDPRTHADRLLGILFPEEATR